MRIISGKYKGAKLFSPMDKRVRPTTDRIKESVFNILANKTRIGGSKVLDLFAGSGALGLEACSRGADKVVFIDYDKDSIKLVKSNVEKLKLPPAAYEIYFTEYEFALKKLSGRAFDIIFADPPYASEAMDKVLGLIVKYDVLSTDGVVVVEHAATKIIEHAAFDSDCRKMGNTSVSFMTRREDL